VTALIITLTSVLGWFTGWFLTARYRVERWRERGNSILSESLELTTRRFDKLSDRPWIAFYALITTFFWPLVLPAMFMSHHLFRRMDKRADAARRAEEKRKEEAATWKAVLKDPDASDIERRVAREVLRGLGVKQ
jgi:hypothetical protein